MVQGISHETDGAEGIRANSCRIKVELNRDGELRELIQLFKQWRAIHPTGSRRVLCTLDSKLPQADGADARCDLFDTLETVDQVGGVERDLCSRCGRRNRYLVASVGDRLLTLGANVLLGFIETFHEIAIARLNSRTESLDVDLTHSYHRHARLPSSGQESA